MIFDQVVPRWQAVISSASSKDEQVLALQSICEQAEMWILHEQSGLFTRFVRLWEQGVEQKNQAIIKDALTSLHLAIKHFKLAVKNRLAEDMNHRLYTVLVVKIDSKWYYLDEKSFVVPFNLSMPEVVYGCLKFAEYGHWFDKPILVPIYVNESQLQDVPRLRPFTHKRDRWLKSNPLVTY